MFLGAGKIDERVGRPLELEDGNPPGIWSAILYSVSLTIFGLLIWSSIAEVREVATTKGELIPVGQIKTVSHFEGGIVDSIYVQQGEKVKKGQLLIRLRSKLVASDLNRLKTRLTWLKLEEIRLTAEVSGNAPDFSQYIAGNYELVRIQQITYRANIFNLIKTVSAIERRISHRNAEIVAIQKEIKSLQNELKTKSSAFNIQNKLVNRGHTTQKDFLERKASLQRAETAVAAAKVRLVQTRKELSDDISEKASKIAETNKTNTAQLAKTIEEKLELTHLIKKHKDQYERLFIRAPIDGIVKDITPKNRGAVILAGKMVAEIVPTDMHLIAEVKIQPKDIGHIKIGDPAELTVTTYDFNVYGKLNGKLTKVSASSFKDNEGQPYFKGVISLMGSTKTNKSTKLDLMSGMLVEANIVTGSKSILRYILKPIYRSVDVAFSER